MPGMEATKLADLMKLWEIYERNPHSFDNLDEERKKKAFNLIDEYKTYRTAMQTEPEGIRESQPQKPEFETGKPQILTEADDPGTSGVKTPGIFGKILDCTGSLNEVASAHEPEANVTPGLIAPGVSKFPVEV